LPTSNPLGDDDLEPFAFHRATEQLNLVVEEVVGEQQIAQVIKERLRGELSGIGDLEDEVLIRQQGHTMLFAAFQGIVLQFTTDFVGIEPAALSRDQVAQDTDFIVN
jgi:hypothetical protein